jgi:hypothetical protein
MALEVAVRSLRPVRGRGPEIWLVGVSHLGTSNYYANLQGFLDRQTLVLFEGVGAREGRFELQEGGGFNLQTEMAKALGLRFQLQAINYNRPHFRNSDLTLEQMSRILSGQTQAPPSVVSGRAKTEAKPASVGGGSSGAAVASTEVPATSAGSGGTGGKSPSGQVALDGLVDAMQGTGLLGGVARFAVSMVAASPRLQAATKLVMIEVLAEMGDDLQQMPGMPAGFAELLRVLIEERNQAVVRDLEKALKTRPRPKSIAVFYGAGHMNDLERRVSEALGRRPSEDRWLTAFDLDPRTAGMSQAEIKWVRSWLRWQFKDIRKTDSAKPTRTE